MNSTAYKKELDETFKELEILKDNTYTLSHGISNLSFSVDSYQRLNTRTKCDKYDYLAAAACGVVGGLIDIFLVGSPADSKLGKWTDEQANKAVMSFAEKLGWKNNGKDRSAVGFLERKFRVNYDQRKPADVNDAFNISPNAHHYMSLGHSPDIIGLFFSVLNQFTSTSSFIADGKLITISTETFELQGGNVIAKIFCGVVNWFAHIMSDIAGGSGAHKRGTGIVAPFYELFGFCKFGKFNTKGGIKDLSEVAKSAFVQGYDARFAATMSIPVVITDLLIRLIWSLRQCFQYKKPIKECLPTQKHDDLRLMLIIGDGTLCLMDGIDAGIRSHGDFVTFFMRLNLVAWFRLVALVIKEILIRTGIKDPLSKQLEAYRLINEALESYLSELEKIDVEAYKIETAKYSETTAMLLKAESSEELSIFLLKTYEEFNIKKPWEGDFDEHMGNKNATLKFE